MLRTAMVTAQQPRSAGWVSRMVWASSEVLSQHGLHPSKGFAQAGLPDTSKQFHPRAPARPPTPAPTTHLARTHPSGRP
jgi:hypothetical protein